MYKGRTHNNKKKDWQILLRIIPAMFFSVTITTTILFTSLSPFFFFFLCIVFFSAFSFLSCTHTRRAIVSGRESVALPPVQNPLRPPRLVRDNPPAFCSIASNFDGLGNASSKKIAIGSTAGGVEGEAAAAHPCPCSPIREAEVPLCREEERKGPHRREEGAEEEEDSTPSSSSSETQLGSGGA